MMEQGLTWLPYLSFMSTLETHVIVEEGANLCFGILEFGGSLAVSSMDFWSKGSHFLTEVKLFAELVWFYYRDLFEEKLGIMIYHWKTLHQTHKVGKVNM